MNNFGTLVRYELRKILGKKSSIIAILVFFLVSIYIFISPVSYTYSEIDISNARSFSGQELNSSLIEEAVNAYQQVPIDGNVNSYETDEYQQIARRYSPIIATISPAYFISRSGSIAEIQNIDPTIYYELRNESVTKRIESIETDIEAQSFLLNENEKIETPFTFHNTTGYMYFLGNLLMVGVLAYFLITFLLSPIFAGEYGKTDDVILSSKNGKKSFIFAKILTSFIITFGVFAFICLTIYFGCMFVYGFDGFNAPIQLLYMESPYALTIGQTAFFSMLVILSLLLLSTTLNIFLSAKFKSTLAIMGIMVGLGLGTQILNVPIETGILYKIFLLIPGNSISFLEVIDTMCYKVGSVVLPQYMFIPIFVLIIVLLAIPLIYKTFRNHQVG